MVEGIIQKFQSSITKRIDDLRESELDLDDVEDEVGRLEKFAKRLEPDFEAELDGLIRTNLVNTSKALLKGYRNKLASLAEEIDVKDLAGLAIDPLKLMGGSIIYDDSLTKKLVRTKEVEDGTEYVQTRGWFESIAFWPKKEWVTKYKKVKFVKGDELAQKFFEPIQKKFYDNGDGAVKYAREQSKKIADGFNTEFERLDVMLKTKLSELESYATDKEKADKRIKETERRLEWLEQIKSKVESILEI